MNKIKINKGVKSTNISFLIEKFLKKNNFLDKINFNKYFFKANKIIKPKYNKGKSKPCDLKIEEIKKQKARAKMYKVLLEKFFSFSNLNITKIVSVEKNKKGISESIWFPN